MKRLALAGLLVLFLAGCGGGSTPAPETTTETAETTAATSAQASGCTASGLDAMTALSDFELEMGEAQKSGKITTDQLLAARDKLFTTTQAAQANEDWAAYCKAIDDTRAELGL